MLKRASKGIINNSFMYIYHFIYAHRQEWNLCKTNPHLAIIRLVLDIWHNLHHFTVLIVCLAVETLFSSLHAII